jgi:protein disulfide-isomerase A1
MAPTWDQLGEKLKDVKGVVIAKMDATENDLPPNAGIDIQGFPTLKLIKAGSNEVVDYDGDRTFDDMVKFLKENTVNGSSIPDVAEAETVAASDDHDEL